MQQNPLKSWALWLSVAALIAFLVKQIFKIDITPFVNGLADVLLPVLVGFGIINNPTAKDSLWGLNHTDKTEKDE